MLVLAALIVIGLLTWRVLDTDDGIPGRHRGRGRGPMWHFAKHTVGTSAADLVAWLAAERENPSLTHADWSRIRLWREVTAWEHDRMAAGGW